MDHLKVITLRKAEKTLCRCVKRGETCELGKGKSVRAAVIRRLVLGLPFDRQTGLIASISGFFEGDQSSIQHSRTPVGFSIKGGTIEGRLDLASAASEDGGPVAALAFEGCLLKGGFSGAHGRFRHLAFNRCRFVDPPAANGRPLPSIDLSGAAIDGDLQIVGAHPESVEHDSELPRALGNHFWIRAVGARVDGEIDLCGSHLRAPPTSERLVSEKASDALDITLAKIGGDLRFLNRARCQGRIKFRAGRLGGDVWMSGASIENPGGKALLIQGTRIDGFLMMNGCFDDVEKKAPFRRFRCAGQLKLEASDIGRSLYLEDAVVRGDIEAPALTVRDDLILHAEVSGPIDLKGCRIGGSLDISQLNLASSVGRVDLNDGSIGRTLKVARPRIPYQLLKARWVGLKCLDGVRLVETLWRLVPDETDEHGEEVPVRHQLVQAAFMVGDHDSRRLRVFHLDGHAETLARAAGHYRPNVVDHETAFEYARLHAAYVLGDEGFIRFQSAEQPYEAGQNFWTFVASAVVGDRIERRCVAVTLKDGEVVVHQERIERESTLQEEDRCFINGLVFPPRIHNAKAIVDAGNWFADGPFLMRLHMGVTWNCEAGRRRPQLALGLKTRWKRWLGQRAAARLKRRIATHIESVPLLQARFDLEGLSCDMLDDCGGRAWGEHFDRIRMNHFVYRRADWGAEPRKTKSTARYIWHRLKGARADWFWSSQPGHFSRRLRDESDYLEPWQVRRNWIYRHFTPHRLRHLISVSRYRIPEEEYRSQPLEQAILVSRAEGREDIAVRFEMLKSHSEWRFFKERARWWLGPLAITLASLWLLQTGGSFVLTIPAWAITLLMMVFVSRINDWLRRGGAGPRRILRFTALYLTLLLPLLLILTLAAPILQGGDVYFVLATSQLALVLMLAVPQIWTWTQHGISDWWPRRVVREVVFYFPALLLLIFEWLAQPFNYLVAFLIYVGIRSAGAFSNLVMWWGFGYLRRPVRAIFTLILAFLLGWWGVHVAAGRDMIVIEAVPVADQAASLDRNSEGTTVMGSRRTKGGANFVHEPTCSHELSEPLYALDVLIPIVDLHQESRCEVRRLSADRRGASHLDRMSFRELWDALPHAAFSDHRFWSWVKAIYAIAGWFLVSLALLTFTQVNRMRGELPAEG